MRQHGASELPLLFLPLSSAGEIDNGVETDMSRPRNVNPTDPLANQSLHYFAFHPIRHLEVTLNALKRGYPPETALQPK